MGSMMAGMGAWMLVWAVLLLALLAGAVAGVVALVRRPDARLLPPGRRERSAVESPEEVLRRRYAAGEIDEDEYLNRMSGLSQR
ncbi:MAG: SHOCT domain-containing protein [Streptosporangiales bacterium]|nr:SHOCT domain-containing protein [Streptosporangiales bacterium]